MAARYNRAHLDLCREKIQTTQLIKRLQDNALAEKEFLTPGQIRSIEICLNKSIPNLQATDINANVDTTIAGVRFWTESEWLAYLTTQGASLKPSTDEQNDMLSAFAIDGQVKQ